MALELSKMTRSKLDIYRKNAERVIKKNQEQSLVIEAKKLLNDIELEIASREMRNRRPAFGLPDEYKWTPKDNRGDRMSKLRCGEEVIAVIRQNKMHKPTKPDRDQYTAQIMGEDFDGTYDDIEVLRDKISKEIARRLVESS